MTSDLIHGLLILAFVVVVPLALLLEDVRPPTCVLIASLGGVTSACFVLPQGLASGLVATIWFLTPAYLVATLFRRWSQTRRVPLLQAVPVAYLLVGAGWLVTSRYGGRPMDFSSDIVELTAVHFHYAGFVAPILARTLARWLYTHGLPSAGVANAAHIGVLAATPLTAAGITFSPTLGALGATLFAISLAATAAVTLYAVMPQIENQERTLLLVSSGSVVISMCLGVAYAFGTWLGTPAPTLSVMVWSHGLLNSIGFSLFGAVGWILAKRRSWGFDSG